MNDSVEVLGHTRFRTLFEQAPVAIWDEDFSSLKQFLDELRASGVENIRQRLESDPDLFMEVIRRVRVRHVNRRAREFYGADTEEDLIRALPSLFDSTAASVFLDEITALAGGASTFTAELMTSTLRGDRRLVQMNVSVLPTEGDDWSQVIVAFTDLTERNRLEHSLKRANEMLQRVNSDLEQFAYAAAHDLREPLRTIGLFAQVLQKLQPQRLGPAAETALTYILQNAARMETLVGDLLAFAQTIEPHDLTHCSDLDSTEIADEVVAGIGHAIEQAGARVVVARDLPAVAIQSGHLRQLFQNLVVNAIKYRSPDRSAEVRITGTRLGGETKFCVSDNGIGIGAEYHDRIFGIFKRLHNVQVQGNGIGLALCKKIVQNHHGTMTASGKVNEGATFEIYLPC